MKLLLIALIGLIFVQIEAHAEWVNGYFKGNGTYVQGYQRADRNDTKTDNYGSSRGSYLNSAPSYRDSDHDGLPNYLDTDDNNNGRSDDNE